ncbi:NYN domain-containing protein [Rothia nasimurium]|uniref:NYN domain-containing protein n=2 Tax=Bacillati TaxID=1783272 RepID=UPI001F1B1905|nr:NYN domain-containing protein [Rothia nasimurium]
MQRRMVLIDIENFNGGNVDTLEKAAWCKQRIESLLNLQPHDQLVVGVDASCVFNVADIWTGSLIRCGYGPNGADLMLLREFDEKLVERFDECIIVSGDKIFTHAVARLRQMGQTVTVLAHPDSISPYLVNAASKVILSRDELPNWWGHVQILHDNIKSI